MKEYKINNVNAYKNLSYNYNNNYKINVKTKVRYNIFYK